MKAICQRCGIEFEYVPGKGTKRKYCTLHCQRAEQAERKYRDKDLTEYSHKGQLATSLIILYGGKCAICGWRATDKVITTKQGRQIAYGNEIHHIKPISEGGKSNYDNLILLCPNHHKQANMGVISQEKLTSYLKKPPTAEELQQMSNNAVDRVAKTIFEEPEPNKDDGRVHYTEEQKKEVYKNLGWL